MSRKIDLSDPSSLSTEDRLYLQDRERLPAGAQPARVPSMVQGAATFPDPITGDVGTRVPIGGAVPPPGDPSHRSIGPEPDTTTTMSRSRQDQSYESLSVSDLKDALKQRGLSTSGNKSELVARLVEDDDSVIEDDDAGSGTEE